MSRKKITITLYVAELLYDIENKTYHTGNSRRGDNNDELVAHMQASEDDEDLNQMLRSLQNAFGAMKTELAEWLNDEDTTATDKLMSYEAPSEKTFKAIVPDDGIVKWEKSTDIPTAPYDPLTQKYLGVSDLPTKDVSNGQTVTVESPGTTLKVSLNMPGNYNESVNYAVSAAMHQYLVNTAIGDWFTMTNKADASDYYTLAAANVAQLRKVINKRRRPTRNEIK